MRTVLVLRQLTGVMNMISGRITRRFGLTSHDLLVFAWLGQRPGMPGAEIAHHIGRTRQSVQRALERLEYRELVERYDSEIHDRTAGWALTEKGQELLGTLEAAYSGLETRVEQLGGGKLLDALEALLKEMMQVSQRNCWSQLVEIPEEPSTPEWDL